MIIEIKEYLFNSNDFKSLNYLIQILTYKQRYELFVEWTIIKETEYCQKLDFDEQKEIEESYNKIIQEGADPKYFVSISNAQNNYFNIEEAIRFFSQPVSIILENSLNDQYFLMAIINYFDTTVDIQKQIDNGWIQFENAGGCTNVENFIKGKLQSFNNFSCQYKKNNCTYLRCFVLLDSDKGYSNAPIKTEYEKDLLPFLNENHVKNHILEKRSMENYMPDEVFSYIANTPELKNWLAVYLHLNSEQKNFLNINSGFSKKNQDATPKTQRNELKQEIQDLYSNISQANYEILDKGFKLASFKTEFPKNFGHHQVHKSTLQDRCGTNELQEIIDKIATLL
jgi:hypothetical protein